MVVDWATSQEKAGGLEAGHEEVVVPSGRAAAGPGVPDHVSQVVGVIQSIVVLTVNDVPKDVEVGHQLLEAVAWQA